MVCLRCQIALVDYPLCINPCTLTLVHEPLYTVMVTSQRDHTGNTGNTTKLSKAKWATRGFSLERFYCGAPSKQPACNVELMMQRHADLHHWLRCLFNVRHCKEQLPAFLH